MTVQKHETTNKFLIAHALKETGRRKCYYFLCLFACFLVSLVSLIAKTVISQGPVIFLMLGEQTSGEMDIVIKTRPSERASVKKEVSDYLIDYAFINYTKFVHVIDNDGKVSTNISSQSTTRTKYAATLGKCIDCEDSIGDVYLIDTDKEKEIELGRSYPLQKIFPGECILHKTLANRLGIGNMTSSVVYVHTKMEIFLMNNLIYNYYMNTTHQYNPNITNIAKIPHKVSFPCKVKYILPENYGKLGQEDNNIVFMEKESFYPYIANFLNPVITSYFDDYIDILNKIHPDEWANQLVVNFPKSRLETYLVSDFEDLLQAGVKYANNFVQILGGLEHLDLSLPIISKMQELNYGSLFLGLILDIIIVILFLLSLILIYSLLLITLETNSFEFGILRLIGTTKWSIVKLIFFQCLSFSFPAFLLAYMLHFSVLDLISKVLRQYILTDMNLHHTYRSILYAFIINNLAPICASIMPIRSLLSKNIATSLNTVYNKTSGIQVEIISIAAREKETMVIFGLLTFLYGASIYYFLPLSMLSWNLGLLLLIFLWILIGMLLAFIVLSLNIENLFHRITTQIFFFFTSSYTKLIISKNLTAHRLKNRKTSLMYSLSVGFFILITVGLNIELKSLELTQLSKKGVYVHLSSSFGPILPAVIQPSLRLMQLSGAIEDYTYISHRLKTRCFDAWNGFSNIGKSMDFSVDVVAISPNFYNVTVSDFLIVEEEMKNGSKIISERLYASEYEGKIGISGIFTWEVDLHLDDFFYLLTQRDNEIMAIIYKPAYILQSSPALQMSSVPSTMYQRAVTLSIPQFMDLINKCGNHFARTREEVTAYSYEHFPIDRVLIKLNRSMNEEDAIKIVSNIVETDKSYVVNIWLYNDYQKNLDRISSICNVIFTGISVVVLFFCFFNLSASMMINIFDQKKEIAILRSLGMKASHILFVYVAEAVVLIFCSSIIGLIIGSIISWTMTLQRQVFTSLPISFAFPYMHLIIIVLFSLFGGLLSTIVPAYGMMKKPISELIRYG